MSWYAPAQAGGSFSWRSSSVYSSGPCSQPQPEPEKPVVLGISRDGRLNLDRLGHRVTLQNTRFRDGAQIMQELQFGRSRPAAVLMLDPDIYQPQEGCLGKLMSGWLKNYVNNGGTLILCRGALESRTQYMNDWMRDTWNLRWWLGTSRDTPMMRTSEAVGRTPGSTELCSLPSQWDSSFRCLSNVAPAHGWYRIPPGATYLDDRNHVRPVPLEECGNVAVAFTPIGRGFLGWIGDTARMSEQQETMIAAMMGLE